MFTPIQKLRTFVSQVAEIASISLKASPALFFGLFGIQIAFGLRPVVSAWVIKRLVDVLADNVQSDMLLMLTENIWFLLILQGLVIISGKFLLDLQAYCRGELSRQLNVITRTMILKKLNTFEGMRYFDKPDFYNTVDAASAGLTYGPPYLIFYLSELFRRIVTLFSFVGILLVLSPWLALLVVLAGIPQLIGRVWMSRMSFQTYQKRQTKERRRNYLSTLLSRPHAMKDIRAFNLSDHIFDEFMDANQTVHALNRDNELKQLGIKSLLNLLVGAVSSGTFGVVVWQALQKLISVGDVTFYFSALIGVMDSVNEIADKISLLNSYTLYFAQFKKLDALPNDLTTPNQPKRVPNLERGVSLKNISFQYQDNLQPVLNNLSLIIPAGKTVALVGENGSGKSTLVKLLTRLYDPNEGQILWDDMDVREFNTHSFREKVAPIFQDFTQYHLTVRENIGLGNHQAITDADLVKRSAEKIGIANTLSDLPQGYDTTLSHHIIDDGSAGMDVSAGEWQKIALARVHIRDADLLILDDPSADLDALAEHQLYQQFLSDNQAKTTLLISGRFSTIRMADAIAVMKNGAIVEYGTHDDLLAKNGEYARLYRVQAEQYL
ncbi:MAG: ABC transporter ATP-binding protein [Phototrophicaceae bacterium]